MGVSFTWEVIGPVEEHSFGHGSTLNKVLEECFGAFPFDVNATDVGVLKGIKACGHDGIQELIDAIYEHEKIRVKSHW